jgi:hypothetical protein
MADNRTLCCNRCPMLNALDVVICEACAKPTPTSPLSPPSPPSSPDNIVYNVRAVFDYQPGDYPATGVVPTVLEADLAPPAC